MVLFSCLSACVPYACLRTWRSEEGIKCPLTGGTGYFVSPSVDASTSESESSATPSVLNCGIISLAPCLINF